MSQNGFNQRSALTPLDYQVDDVLADGPATLFEIAAELDKPHESIRRSVIRLRRHGMAVPKLQLRGEMGRPTTLYEASRTRRAA